MKIIVYILFTVRYSDCVETMKHKQRQDEMKTKSQTKKELIETLDWVLKNLNKNTLGTIELEHGVGTIVDAHLFKMKLKHAIKLAKR